MDSEAISMHKEAPPVSRLAPGFQQQLPQQSYTVKHASRVAAVWPGGHFISTLPAHYVLLLDGTALCGSTAALCCKRAKLNKLIDVNEVTFRSKHRNLQNRVRHPGTMQNDIIEESALHQISCHLLQLKLFEVS